MNGREREELVPAGSFWLRTNPREDGVFDVVSADDFGRGFINYVSYRMRDGNSVQGYGSAVAEVFVEKRLRVAFAPAWSGVARDHRVDWSWAGEHELTVAQLAHLRAGPSDQDRPPVQAWLDGGWRNLGAVERYRWTPGQPAPVELTYDEGDEQVEVVLFDDTTIRLRLAEART